MKRTWLATSLVLALSILAGAPAVPAHTAPLPAAQGGLFPAAPSLTLPCGATIYCETCAERGGHCVLGSGGSCTCQR